MLRSLLLVSCLALPALSQVGDNTACDATGTSSRYTENLDTSGSVHKRQITTSGCPNHYSKCTGKSAVQVCGGVGEEGTATEAKSTKTSVIEIPAKPILRNPNPFTDATSLTTTSNGGNKCVLGIQGVALNGVSIFGGAVDTQCTGIDVDNAFNEWTGFDCCTGHSEQTGEYHYHFPPSCLLKQRGDLSDGHSPQVGWAFDGFPIYGPKGVGGIDMKYSAAACTIHGTTCSDTCTDATYCLDACGGYEGTISHDNFNYRYYIIGAASDLTRLPSNPKPASGSTPFAFTMNCQRGFSLTELNGGSTGTDGFTGSYTATATAGTTTATYTTCSGGSSTDCYENGWCSTLTTSSCNSNFAASTTCVASSSSDDSSSDDSSSTDLTGLWIALGVVGGLAIVGGSVFAFLKCRTPQSTDVEQIQQPAEKAGP